MFADRLKNIYLPYRHKNFNYMQKESLINVKYSSEKIIHTSLFIYLFLLIFPHTTTLREISFWIAAICCVLLRLRKSEPFIPLNPIVISLSIFIGIAFISSVIGMEPLENLKRFKGELLIPFLLFLITATEYKTLQKAKSLFIAPVIAFAAYTVLVIGESFNYGFVFVVIVERLVRTYGLMAMVRLESLSSQLH